MQKVNRNLVQALVMGKIELIRLAKTTTQYKFLTHKHK